MLIGPLRMAIRIYAFLMLCVFFVAMSYLGRRYKYDRGDMIYIYNMQKRDKELDLIWSKLKPEQRIPDGPEPKERPASEAPGRVVPPEAESLAGGSPHVVGDERGMVRSIRQ